MMHLEKRRDKRINKKLMVSLDNSGIPGLAVTSDLSKTGMCLESNEEIDLHKEIEISIAVPGDVFTLKGEVIWCKKSLNSKSEIPDAIGIKVLEAPADYFNYIEFLKHQSIRPGKPEF